MDDSELFPGSSSNKPSSNKSNGPYVALAIALGASIAAGVIGQACGRGLARLSGPLIESPRELPRKSTYSQNRTAAIWKTYSPEGTQMSLELPGEPKLLNEEIPTDLKASVFYFRSYGLQQAGLEVVVTHFEYVPMNVLVSAEDSARGFVQGLWKNSGVSDFQSSINNTSPSETKFSANYLQDHVRYEVNGFSKLSGLKMWSVACAVQSGDANADLMATRILSSVVIKQKIEKDNSR